MKINKKLFIKFTILFVLINCSSNNQFLEIDYSKNANLVTMEQKFYKSSGSGKLIAKGKNNFVYPKYYYFLIWLFNLTPMWFYNWFIKKMFSRPFN